MKKLYPQSQDSENSSTSGNGFKNFKKQKIVRQLIEYKKQQQCDQALKQALKNKKIVLGTKSKFLSTPLKSQVKKNRTRQLTKSSKKITQFLEKEQICSICLDPLSEQEAITECQHKFCLCCLEALVPNSNKCPNCRRKFKYYMKEGQKVAVPQRQEQKADLDEDEYITDPCIYCGNLDDVPSLILCDRCTNFCVHFYCDPALRGNMPRGDWICPICIIQQQLLIGSTMVNNFNSRTNHSSFQSRNRGGRRR